MLEYMEKRDYMRMAVDCAANLRLSGADENLPAIVKDLSATGVLVWIDQEIEAGTSGTISILPGKNITPPLSAEIEIIRCEPREDDPTSFAAACHIKEILKVDAA
ncbi:MAG: PilZ domain-containing protein [Chromatiales bacterium]|jgi:hypothetical protein